MVSYVWAAVSACLYATININCISCFHL